MYTFLQWAQEILCIPDLAIGIGWSPKSFKLTALVTKDTSTKKDLIKFQCYSPFRLLILVSMKLCESFDQTVNGLVDILIQSGDIQNVFGPFHEVCQGYGKS